MGGAELSGKSHLLAVSASTEAGIWLMELSIESAITDNIGSDDVSNSDTRSVAVLHTFSPISTVNPFAFRAGLRYVDYEGQTPERQKYLGAYGGVAFMLPIVGSRLSIFGNLGYNYLIGEDDSVFRSPAGEVGLGSRLAKNFHIRAGVRYRQREILNASEDTLVDEEWNGSFFGIRVDW